MKNLFLVFLGVLIEMTTLAQQPSILDSVININKDLISFNIFDTSFIYTYSKPQNGNSYILINGSSIDSLSRAVIRNPVYVDNKIFFNSDVYLKLECQKYKKIMYSFKNKSLSEYSSCFFHDNGYQQMYRFNGLKLYLVDPSLGEVLLFVDLTDFAMNAKYIKKETDDFGNQYSLVSILDVFFINKNEAILTLCKQGDFDGCYGYYYLYISTDKLVDITSKIELKDGLNSYYNTQKLNFDFISSDNNYFRLSINTPSKIEEKISKIFDKNMTYVNSVLNLDYNSIVGINLQKGKIENYFLKSELNNGTEVIIPYKFIPKLDIAMYKAYNDTLLTNDEVADFGKYELGIFRNLIFAKHNYDFSKEFYQAYFNLYAFYNNEKMRKTRTKDVNGKLTEADKTNLKLIKEQEAKVSQ